MSSLFLHAAGAVGRRRGRSAILVAGLSLAVALVSAILFLTDALRLEARRASAAQPDVVVQRLIAGRPALLDVSEEKALSGVLGVRRVDPRVWGYLFVPELQGNLAIVGVRGPSLPAFRAALHEGKDLSPGVHEMVMGRTAARKLGLSVGETLALPNAYGAKAPPPSLVLAGTFRADVDLWTADIVLCDEADARALLGMGPTQATDLAVWVSNPAEATVVARTAIERLPGVRVIERSSLDRTYALAYGRRSGLVLAATIPALLALMLLALGRAGGLGPEEAHEIAVLKAVGFGTRDVLVVKMVEALIVGGLGTALGLLLGYGWVFWWNAPGLRQAIVGWSVLYPEATLTPAVDLAQLLAIAAVVLGPFVGLSILPAWRAAIVDPMEAMRR
jgi:ABC-type lipoprotein release transport system permease subunit